MHQCFSCRTIFVEAGAVLTITARFPARFAGPPGTANGGIIAGALACPALNAATRAGVAHAAATRISARIRAAVPLETPLAVDVATPDGAYAVTIRDGDAALITGAVEIARLDAPPRPGDLLAPVPEARSSEVEAMSRVRVPDRPPFFEETGDHPIRGCFSCGPDNTHGLRIYPRSVDDGVVCAPWQPSPEFDDGGGALSTLVLASALDCSSGICMPLSMQRDLLAEDRFFLLGSLELRLLRVPPLTRGYRVVAQALAREGRKFFGLSALFDDDGTPYAMVESTWIVAGATRSEAFGASTGRKR